MALQHHKWSLDTRERHPLHLALKNRSSGGNDFQRHLAAWIIKWYNLLLFDNFAAYLLALGNGIFDSSHIEERRLGQVVHLAIENHLEALDGILN